MAKTQVDDINRSIYNIKNEDNYSYKMKKGLDEGIVREISQMKTSNHYGHYLFLDDHPNFPYQV